MPAIRFFGPIGEGSGYGQAVKNFAEAFSLTGFDVQYKFPQSKKTNFKSYNGKTDIDFYLHCPPYEKHRSSNYKIGYFYWEADRLPNNWRNSLNVLNELWVPCNLVKQACISSGYKGKIKIVPTPIKLFEQGKKISIPSDFSNNYILSNDIFKFYSIFQWHERKGYKELLKSYLSEFSSNDNVVLILKVNPLNIGDYTEAAIKRDILKTKGYVGKANSPKIFLSKKLVQKDYIHGLHAIGDCYVAPHHGEGWGMPIHDAMYCKKQIITTKFGGVTEYLDDNSAHLIRYDLKPVSNMEWSPLYGSYQKWAYPDVQHLSSLMRDVYENKNKYGDKAERAHLIAKSMDIHSIAQIIKKELSNR